MASLTGFFKSLFGRSKTVAADVTDKVGDAAAEVTTRVGDVVEPVVEQAVETVTEVVEQVTAPLTGAVTQMNGARVMQLDRISLLAPQSSVAQKAIDLLQSKAGAAGRNQGMRTFEYALAAGAAYGLRPDKELLLISSLFSVLGGEGANAARQFCLDNGMWPSLADRVGDVVEGAGQGGGDEAEGKLLALGRDAESASGASEWLHTLTAQGIAKRYPAK